MFKAIDCSQIFNDSIQRLKYLNGEGNDTTRLPLLKIENFLLYIQCCNKKNKKLFQLTVFTLISIDLYLKSHHDTFVFKNIKFSSKIVP